jgi:mono/diheme cytochrome c family protein
MRYFLAAFLLMGVLVAGMAGFRGSTSRKPPIELFPDMDRQPKLQPQHESQFFADHRSSRLPVDGTIPRTSPFEMTTADTKEIVAFQQTPATTGMVTGTTNFVATSPFEYSAQLVARGRDRYQINCLPCHGPVGDGNGITKKFGMAAVADLHQPRIVSMPDGELFHVITNGRSTMGAYGPQVSVEDRWAIVGYVRALQLSRLASTNDVPEQSRASLKK